MKKKEQTNYWLFQAHEQQFLLGPALRMDAVHTFPVKAHKKKIKKGDKVILWKTGENPGVYGLAGIRSGVDTWKVSKEQKSFYLKPVSSEENVKITIEYNLWNRPITKDLLAESKEFDKFYGGLSGVTYKATKRQYELIAGMAQRENLVEESIPDYIEGMTAVHPLNLILHGPPGTGKTYKTIDHALAIIEHRTLEELALEPRADRQQRYQEYVEEGLIYFVTFHQSFTYEDFVEGIKPITEKGQIRYEIQNGIFKHIALEARQELVEDIMEAIPAPHQLVEFKPLYKSFLQFLKSDEFESFPGPNGSKLFLHRIERSGNLKVRKEKFFGLGSIARKKLEKIYYEFQALDATELMDPLAVVRSSANVSNAEDYLIVFAFLQQFEQRYLENRPLAETEDEQGILPDISMARFSEIARQTTERFVLIIDEINRANIASVFGELISLIEPNKREGAPEALHLILPYSKTMFSVPPNLYLLATMNTADRSIENLDFALRRRFAFEAVLPDPTVISKLNQQPLMDGIHLELLLKAINERIALLLDHAHCIGHSYFLQVQNLADLRKVFNRSVIPLLKEYFFADPGEIGLVLGKAFMEVRKVDTDVFADFQHPYVQDFSDRKRYRIKSADEVDAAGFMAIYE